MPKNKEQLECIVCKEKFPYTKISERVKYCPFCNAEWWDKPIDEYLLFKLQEQLKKLQIERIKEMEEQGINKPPYQKESDTEEYEKYCAYLRNLNTREIKKVLADMYLKLRIYSIKIIKKLMKNKFYLDRESLKEKASDSANKVIEYYLTKPEFIIEASFAGYLIWPIKSSLYGNKKQETELSLDYVVERGEDDSHQYLLSNYGDPLVAHLYNPEMKIEDETQSLVNALALQLNKITQRVIKEFGPSKALYNLILLENKFSQKSDKFINYYLDTLPTIVKTNYENSLFILFKYIKDFYH